MLEVCRTSPAPAVLVRAAEGDRLRWELNPACASWPLVSGWPETHWQQLAHRVLEQAALGRVDGEDIELGLAWRSAAHEDGRLAWLLPRTTLMGAESSGDTAIDGQLSAGRLMGLSMWRLDLATQWIRANGWGFEMAGVAAPESGGLPVDRLRERIHPDDLPGVVAANERAAAPGGGVVYAEARYRQPDGSWRTLLTRRIAERDGEGRAVALLGLSVDVTDQVLARRREEAAELGLRLITEATGVGVWRADLASATITWHGEMQRILGAAGVHTLSFDEARRLIEARLHEGDRPVLQDALARMAARDFESGEWTFRIRRADGTLACLVNRLRRLRQPGGGELFGVVIDVTEQQRAQARLQGAEQRALLATEVAGFGVWQRNLETGARHWDAQMYRLRGLSPDDPRSYDDIARATVEPEDQAVLDAYTEEIRQRALAGDLPADFLGRMIEFRVNRMDGSQRWLCSRATVVREPDGTHLLIGLHWDITEHKHHEQLRRERAAAEQANLAKSAFLANMSHEIRTPMNAVLGMSHLALRSGLNAQQRNYVLKIERSAQSLLRLINDILDFSKIEAGKLDLETAEFDLDDVMDSLANLVGLQAEDKKLELLFNQAAQVPRTLVGDPLRLSQVLVNLGSNAVKFTESGEIVVASELVAQTGDRVRLRFSVSDTGVGLEPEEQDRLFHPFEQADASVARLHGGTGLGLAISHRLVELMGGRLAVTSEAGRGSTFYFELDFGLPQADAEPAPEQLAVVHGARVLIVDDNSSARQILSEMARALGMVVDEAVDGWDALRAVALAAEAGRAFDLVLLDWKMPGMDGVKCAHQLMTGRHGSQPMVLMATAFGREEVTQRLDALKVRVGDVMVKPVTPSALLEACAAALTRAGRSGAEAGAPAPDGGHRRPLRGARVLLVEDNEINQELAFELLAEAGIEVTVAENGQQALDALETQSFDGVLMDCQMPVLDGYEAARAIRAQPRLRELPIIAMTANAMMGDREQALAAGMNDHVTKPIDVEAMFATLARWIRPGRERDPGPTRPQSLPAAPVAALVALPGIDVAVGHASTMGNDKLYRRLLAMFRDHQRDFEARFRAALDAGDAQAAIRLAHDMRSQSGSLGALSVQGIATELENALLTDTPVEAIDFLLQALVDELGPVLAGLEEIRVERL